MLDLIQKKKNQEEWLQFICECFRSCCAKWVTLWWEEEEEEEEEEEFAVKVLIKYCGKNIAGWRRKKSLPRAYRSPPTMACVLKRLREMWQDVASLLSQPMKCIKTPNSLAPFSPFFFWPQQWPQWSFPYGRWYSHWGDHQLLNGRRRFSDWYNAFRSKGNH